MAVATQTPWWMYPTDSPGGGYGQGSEPLCAGSANCYLKPDTNIAVPSGTPITALLPGTVTDVSNRGGGAGGLSVTVKLDNAINNLAQYVSYNYLGNANVAVGQHLGAGQQLGTAGSPTGINFALALGSDPVWGSGSGFAQNAKGNPLLNPMQVINAALAGKLGDLKTFLASNNNTGSNQVDCGNITDPNFLACNIDNWVTSWFSSDQAHQAMLVIFALIVIVIGIVILFTGKGATSAKAKTAS